MKVLFIGPYRQQDGWGQSARSLISSLLTTDVDLSLRPLYLARTPMIESSIYDILERKTDKYDVIIQNCLPEQFSYYHGSKNIGFFCSETHNLQFTPWITSCNLMDEIWTHSTIEKEELIKSGAEIPVYSIGGSIDIAKFQNPPERKFTENFIFYFIGGGERKNVNALITAFHREFDRCEPVELVLKITGQDQQTINDITEFKRKLAIYPHVEQYKTEQIIPNYLSESQIDELHVNCDCFVCPSHGEAWCYPALDALGFGNTPIISSFTGMTDFITHQNGYHIATIQVPVICQNRPLQYIYTAREYWMEPSILHLQDLMRKAYNNKINKTLEYKEKIEQGKKDIQYYSHKNTGKRLNDILCA